MQRTLREPILNTTSTDLTPSKPKRHWTSAPAPLTGFLMVLSLATFAAIFTVNGNFGAFLLPVPERLLWWGANYMPFTFGMGEYWRLATGLFAHAGILHLLTNLYVLHDLGSSLERTAGWRRYLLLILASGASASLSAVTQDPTFVSCGLSGVIFAILSCLFIMSGSPQGKQLVFARQRWLVLVFVGYMLALGFITQGVDNAAHIAGLTTGCFFGWIYAKRGWEQRWSSIDSLAAVAAVTLFVAVFGTEAQALTGKPELVRLAECRSAMTVAKWHKNYPLAIKLMDEAIGDQCSEPTLYITRAGFLAEQKRYSEAVADYNSVLNLNPGDKAALAGRSIAYHNCGQEEQAIQDLSALIKLDPARAISYNNRAWSLVAMGNSQAALLDCDRALKLDSRMSTIYDTKAVVLMKEHRAEEALVCINKALSLGGVDGAAFYHRGQILLAMGRIEESVRDFRNAEKLKYEPETWEQDQSTPHNSTLSL